MKILVIDNAGQIAACLAAIDAELVCFSDEIQALNDAGQQQPELILLDYGLRGEQTPEYIRLLLEAARTAKLVVISNELDEDRIICCLMAGANGYQDCRQLPDYAGRLVSAVVHGEAWLSRKMVVHLLEAIRQQFGTQTIIA